MRYVVFFLLIPAFAFPQKVNEHWITPVANIEFGENSLIYSYSADECVNYERIIPVHYNTIIVEVKGIMGAGCISDYKDMYLQIYSYVDEWYYGIASNKDKFNFLKATSLLIFWNIGNKDFLPGHTLEILGYLKTDMSIEIARATEQVAKLYAYYCEE